MNPSLPLVAELVRRGERITYVTPSDFSRDFRPAIEATGATFMDAGTQDDDFVPLYYDNLLHLARRLLQPVKRALDTLLPILQHDPPDYILHDASAPWGPALASILGVPAVASVPLLIMTGRPDRAALKWLGPVLRHPRFSAGEFIRFRRLATELVRDYQLPRPRIANIFTSYGPLNIAYTSRLFQPNAAELDDRFKFVGRVLVTEQARWDPVLEGLGDRPLVYVSLGTEANDRPDFFRACFAAFAGLDCDVIVSLGGLEPHVLEAPPANVRVASWVDQAAVLQRSAAIVCQAGMGTIHDAFAFGLPLLTAPQFGDQFLNAARVDELGAGVRLTANPSAAEIRAAMTRVLTTPSYAAASRRLGDSLREAGGHVRAADEVLAYVSHAGRQPSPAG